MATSGACTGSTTAGRPLSSSDAVQGPLEVTDPLCRAARVGVQVLGSGGPIPDDGRASAAYLVWSAGRSRVLIDAGGGSFQRFGAAQARIEDLDVVAISHLHADHAAGLGALLKGGYFVERQRPLIVVGPAGSDAYPSIEAFLRNLVDPERGNYRYLSGYVTGESLFPLRSVVVDPSAGEARRVFEGDGLRIEACGVRHGQVPALGFSVTTDGAKIAFTGDQSARGRDTFISMIEGADLLIAHHAIPEGADDLRHLHATPSEIGALAAAAHVGKLVLSHNMRRSLDDLDAGVVAIRRHYSGPLVVAEDLQCFSVVRGEPSD